MKPQQFCDIDFINELNVEKLLKPTKIKCEIEEERNQTGDPEMRRRFVSGEIFF